MAIICGVLGSAAAIGQVTNPGVNFTPNLPLLSLVTTNQIASDKKIACTLQLSAPSGQERFNVGPSPATVKYHGASSQAFAKKSLAITLEKPAPLLGMGSSPHWVANAAFIDRSLMRHKLSYDLFLALSTTNAPRRASQSRFIEVMLNGKYHGAYLLIERVDRTLLGLKSFNSNDVSHACIYKAFDHGGGFGQPGHGPFEQREPDPTTGAYWKPIDDLAQFASRSSDAEFRNPTNGIASWLDVGSAIDFHLLVLLTSNMDGYDKNFIIACDAEIPPGNRKRFFFVPWDYDATFGRNWEASRVGPDVWLTTELLERLLKDPAYKERFAARWKELRSKQFSKETIFAMIDENVRTLGDAVKRNATRWQSEAGVYPDKTNFEQDIAQMKDWIPARLAWLDKEIAARTAR